MDIDIECTFLTLACINGNVQLVRYLIGICKVDIEEKATHEPKQPHPDVEEDENEPRDNLTPLCWACIVGHLPVVECLVGLGANVDAPSDGGLMPLQIACAAMRIDIVQCLVENGADVRKPRYNGRTCLFDSLPSIELCTYLLEEGIDVNVRDIHGVSALQCACVQNNVGAINLLLDHGADPFVWNCNGDDALQVACIVGAVEVAEYLMERIDYSIDAQANAHEILGIASSRIEETLYRWKQAHSIRMQQKLYIEKRPSIAQRPEFGNTLEFCTNQELDAMASDTNEIRIQGLLICERILGINHEFTLSQLMIRGFFYQQTFRFQICIDLWLLALEVRIRKHSILHCDTSSTALAIVKLMMNLLHRKNVAPPQFEDIFAVLQLLTSNIGEIGHLLSLKPVHRKQQQNYDCIVHCLAHLIHLLLNTARGEHHLKQVKHSVEDLLRNDVRSPLTGETLLHISVSIFKDFKSEFCIGRMFRKRIFPNLIVTKLLLECGAPVNAHDQSKSTPLAVASLPSNYDEEVVRTLIAHGAHSDRTRTATGLLR